MLAAFLFSAQDNQSAQKTELRHPLVTPAHNHTPCAPQDKLSAAIVLAFLPAVTVYHSSSSSAHHHQVASPTTKVPPLTPRPNGVGGGGTLPLYVSETLSQTCTRSSYRLYYYFQLSRSLAWQATRNPAV
jgi:hypothetical protein